MGQHAQLNLRVIGVHKDAPFGGHKQPSYLPPQLHAHRDILEVRLRAADAACGGDRLVKRPVDPPVLPDKGGQAVCIRGFQLRHLAVIQDLPDHRIIRRQLFQHIRRRGVAGLRLLPARHFHFPEQNFTELLGGIDIKFTARIRVDLLLQPFYLHLEAFPVRLKLPAPDRNSLLLHMVQAVDHRHLDLIKQLPHAGL